MDAPSTTGAAIPETLGRYRLLAKIAKGGMAEVFAARSYGVHGFEKTVALKRILPRFGQDPQFVRMMVDEAKISVLLNHPNIAQILELGEQDGDYFIVMEFVPGQSLSALIKRLKETGEKVPPLEACFVVVELLQGLHAAHIQTDMTGKQAGIIHRDVSPQNLLLSFDGHVKVIDFGIARARDRLEATEVGTIKGKLRYLAPEMIDPGRFTDSGDFDHRVDVFAAGICLWELIAGRTMFPGDDELKVYDDITDGKTPDLAKEGLCEPALMKIIGKALERHLDKRYASAEEFSDELRAFVYRKDPGFTHKRVAAVLDRAFPDEKAELTSLERGMSGAEIVSLKARDKKPSASASKKNAAAPSSPPEPAETRHMRSDKHLQPPGSLGSGGDAINLAKTALVDVDAVDPDHELPRKDLAVVTLVSRQHVMATTNGSKQDRSDSSGVFSMPDDATLTISADTLREEKAKLEARQAAAAGVRAPMQASSVPSAPAPKPERVNRPTPSSSSSLPSARLDETPMTRQASSPGRVLPARDNTQVRNRLIAASAAVGVLLALGIVAVIEFVDEKPPVAIPIVEAPQTNPTPNPVANPPTNPPTNLPTNPPTNPTVAAASSTVTLTVTSQAPGAVVHVGDKSGPAPFSVEAKPGESVPVRVVANGAREEVEAIVVPKDASAAVVVDVAVHWLAVPVLVRVEPANAEVLINGDVVDKDATVDVGNALVVDISAAGHASARQELTAQPGKPLVISATLAKDKNPKKTTPPKETPPKETPPTSTKPGTLTLKTTPYWGTVTIDGKVYDEQTPLSVQLAPGKHEVTVAHPPKGLMKKFKVVIKPGETQTRMIPFE